MVNPASSNLFFRNKKQLIRCGSARRTEWYHYHVNWCRFLYSNKAFPCSWLSTRTLYVICIHCQLVPPFGDTCFCPNPRFLPCTTIPCQLPKVARLVALNSLFSFPVFMLEGRDITLHFDI